ncbi:alcohol dehydrogenase catalytic domain-containing protein [Salinifilum ghardaiensis]
MKAAALTAPERIEIIDAPEPTCGPRDVLVRVLGAGLCGTDSAVVRGSRKVPALPRVLGHEGVGEIIAAGEAVGDRAVGQRVVIEPTTAAGAASSADPVSPPAAGTASPSDSTQRACSPNGSRFRRTSRTRSPVT